MKKNLILILGISLFCCCSQSDETLKAESDSLVPLTVSSVTIPHLALSKAEPLNAGTIGVFQLSDNKNGYTGRKNVRFDFFNNQWKNAGQESIEVSNTPSSICAYYPYNLDSFVDANNPTETILSSQLYDSTKDFCYSEPAIATNVNSTVGFTMKHAYSMLTFKVIRDASRVSDCAISDIKISGGGICSSAVLDIAKGAYLNPTVGSVECNPQISKIETSCTISILIIPAKNTDSRDMLFDFTIDGRSFKAKLPQDINMIPNIVAGENYSTEFTVNSDNMRVGSVSVSDWIPQSLTLQNNITSLVDESNCYMMKPNQQILIPVSRVNTARDVASALGVTLPSLPNEWKAELLWYDQSLNKVGCCPILELLPLSNYISVKSSNIEGNAVIAIKDLNDRILWSWHIWVTNYSPRDSKELVKEYNGRVWMDRNLGALSNSEESLESFGLFYQWGRKDPFINANVPNENRVGVTSGDMLTTSISNPTFFIKGSLTNGNDWCSNVRNKLSSTSLWACNKTIFDPCPIGWKVPSYTNSSPWEGFQNYVHNKTTNGYTWTEPNIGFYPCPGFLSDLNGDLIVTWGSGKYWSTKIERTEVYSFSIDTYNIYESKTSKSLGHNVRCVQDIY